MKLGALLVLASAIAATLLQDIHGPPVPAGALAGLWRSSSVPLPKALNGQEAAGEPERL